MRRDSGAISDLTDRQKEVLVLISQGALSKEIAHQLRISLKTVEFHRGRIMSRVGALTAGDLVRKFMSSCGDDKKISEENDMDQNDAKLARVRITVERTSEDELPRVSIDWLTKAAPSSGLWVEGDPIVEVAKNMGLVESIRLCLLVRAIRVVVDL